MKSQLNTVPATEKEPAALVPALQAMPAGVGSLSATVQMIHNSSRQAAQRRVLDAIRGTVVQRTSVKDIKATLVANSGERASNAAYRSLLSKLDEIHQLDTEALTSGDFALVMRDIEQLIPTIDTARSTKGFSATNATRVARNNALNTLKVDLRAKAAEMERKIDADTTEAAPAFQMGAGAKAGFEMEYCKVLVFDVTGLTPFQRRVLTGEVKEMDQKFWSTVQKKAGYNKRATLFTAPHNTWEGQADSTLECSNLELVTRPMTAGEWLNPGGAAQQDAAVLARVTTAIRDAPEYQMLMPKELDAGLRLQESGVRLYKTGNASEPQIQMTAAVAVVGDGQPVPAWWLPGMHWAAMRSIRNVVGGMVSDAWGRQRNPKSGAFMQGGVNILVKSPIPNILGTPAGAVLADQQEAWVQGMATLLHVNLGANATEVICRMSETLNPRNANMHLQRGDFTWRAYFLALITGRDLIAEWARTAFGTEDAGVGQINDPTLDHTRVIEEHRATAGITSQNYLDMAREWANNGAVPYHP